jgi:sarcosine oxidase subunit alpha
MQEGFRSAEHVKRYTTLGMAPDQGKISNVIGLGIMAKVANQTMKDIGTTIFRPPYTPVPIGAFAGPHTGQHFRPTQETPSHKFTREKNAKFVESGAWLRAQYIPQGKETHWRESVDREVIAIRNYVGITDVSTLGKIDVQGVDAADFLDKIYANTITTLNVGHCRYGLMLREDGIVMDDGTVAHLSLNHYVITTTTANAAQVYRHMEFCHQCLWPDLDVSLIPVTEQWAQYAIAGPKSRILLKQLVDQNYDISNTAFPYLSCGEITICHGIRARLFRLSFSGELAYEIAVPNRYGDALIRKLMQTGENLNAVLYGTEAMGVMRIEKGHPAGNELNGRTTARDLGFGKMVSKKKDCIGNVLSQRVGLNQNDRPILVGFKSTNPQDQITAGSHLFGIGEILVPDNDLGYLTSVAYSPMLENYIALGYLKQGKYRKGEKLRAIDMLQNKDIEIEVVSPHFFDPEGVRLHG